MSKSSSGETAAAKPGPPHPDAAVTSPWPDADRPERETIDKKIALIVAAESGDLTPAHQAIQSAEPRLRETAVELLGAAGQLDNRTVQRLQSDPDSRVRRAVVGIGARDRRIGLVEALSDADPSVVEIAAWALGERFEGLPGRTGDVAAPAEFSAALEALTATCRHADALCREAAVAALGSIGDERGLAAILAATTDKATVRRRAVLSLAPFDGPEVDEALKRALGDRDWQVRQAAEDLS